MTTSIAMTSLIDCAADTCLAVIFYRKGVTARNLKQAASKGDDGGGASHAARG